MKKTQRDLKVSRYIQVYSDILKMILNGIYPQDSRLPSENELSAMFGVSRMTLRQALLLLQEDGYIEMRHGSGSYVCKSKDSQANGLEMKTNPIYKCCSKNVVLEKFKYRIGAPNEYTVDTLGREVQVMGIERVYEQEGIPSAYAFTTLPIDTLEICSINHNKKEELQRFVEESIYEIAHVTKIDIRFVKGNELIKDLKIPTETNNYVLLLESVYDNKGVMLIHNKFFIPAEHAKLSVFTH